MRPSNALGQQDVVHVIRIVTLLRGSMVCGPVAVNDKLFEGKISFSPDHFRSSQSDRLYRGSRKTRLWVLSGGVRVRKEGRDCQQSALPYLVRACDLS